MSWATSPASRVPPSAGVVPLAAIWGSSFLFIRVSVPALGAFGLADARAGLGALVVAAVLCLRRRRIRFTQGFWKYLLLGAFASAAPYVLMSYATEQQGATLTAIFFATVPLFSVLIELLWFQLWPGPKVVLGLLVGLSGVTLVVHGASSGHDVHALASYAAALAAAAFSALGGNYSRRHFTDEDPLTQTCGQSATAAMVMAPVLIFAPPRHLPSPGELGALIGLGVLCTALAYTLFFWLVAHLGATRALTTELLVPAFAALWAWLFLDEHPPAASLGGAVVILIGCALVMGWHPGIARRRRTSPEPVFGTCDGGQHG
jgi:drug/metabolite transporter (DMT)-like permease